MDERDIFVRRFKWVRGAARRQLLSGDMSPSSGVTRLPDDESRLCLRGISPGSPAPLEDRDTDTRECFQREKVSDSFLKGARDESG